MASKPSPTHRWRWCWRCRKFIRRNLFWKTTTLLQIVYVIFQDFSLKWQAVALHVIFEEMQNCSVSSRSTWISKCFERCARISSSPLPLHISDILVLIYMKLSTFSTASPFIQRYPLSNSFAMLPILWIALYSTPVRSQSPLYSFFLYSKQ